MGLGVSSNIYTIQRAITQASSSSADSMKRMSTGNRISSAKDDAAGLAISSRMNSRLQGMNVAMRNAGNGQSLAEAADSALGQTSDLLTRMKELATQAANATNGTSDMAQLDKEFQQLSAEVTRTLSGADFNGIKMLAGGAGAKDFIVGADATDTITVTTNNMTANANITAVTGGDLTSAANAKTAMTNIGLALDDVNTERSMYGAVQSRFESITTGLQSQSEALSNAKSRITDTDYAAESANLQKQSVLQQAATAMVACSRARATWIAMETASFSGKGPSSSRRSFAVFPSTNSMAM